jgi:hypothetical protein
MMPSASASRSPARARAAALFAKHLILEDILRRFFRMDHPFTRNFPDWPAASNLTRGNPYVKEDWDTGIREKRLSPVEIIA